MADSPGRRKPQTKAAGDYCDKRRENVGIGQGLPVEIEGILGNEKWNGNGKKTNQRMPGEENDLKYGIKVGVGHREGGGGKWTAIVFDIYSLPEYVMKCKLLWQVNWWKRLKYAGRVGINWTRLYEKKKREMGDSFFGKIKGRRKKKVRKIGDREGG